MGTERKAAEALAPFLPMDIINNPEFSPEHLLQMWEGWDRREFVRMVGQLESDRKIIWKMVALYRGSSMALKDSPNGVSVFAKWAVEQEQMIDFSMKAIRKLVGSTDSRTLVAFPLYGMIARTKHYLESIGENGSSAAVFAVSCAIHLGKVPFSEFGLSSGTDLRKIAGPLRTKLIGRVKKGCTRYIERLRSARKWLPLGPIRGPKAEHNQAMYKFVKHFIDRDRLLIE